MIKIGVPHIDIAVWGTPIIRCGAHRFYGKLFKKIHPMASDFLMRAK